MREAVIEMKSTMVEMKNAVKGIYGVINDLTLSLYHIIKDRRSYQDMLEGNEYLG